MHYLYINKIHQELQRTVTLTELVPSPFYSNTNVHLVDINVLAKSDEILLLPVCPSPYFSIINVHLVDINETAKFYEILSLPFQDFEKPKHCRRM